MTRDRMIVRWALVIIFSPLAAGFAAAFTFTALMFFFLPGGGLENESAGSFFTIAFFYGLLASFFGAPLSIVAALASQIPLMMWYRKKGRAPFWPHLAFSAVAGIVLLWLLVPLLTPLGTPRIANAEDLVSAMAVGSVGGIAVGLLWHGLILKPLFESD